MTKDDLLAFHNLPLPGSEIGVEFGNAAKNGNSGKGLDDLKHFLNLRLQVDEGYLLSLLLQKLAGGGENPEPGAADERQLGEVKDQVLDLRIEGRGELRFELRGGGGVEATTEFHGQGGVAGTVDLTFDFDV